MQENKKILHFLFLPLDKSELMCYYYIIRLILKSNDA